MEVSPLMERSLLSIHACRKVLPPLGRRTTPMRSSSARVSTFGWRNLPKGGHAATQISWGVPARSHRSSPFRMMTSTRMSATSGLNPRPSITRTVDKSDYDGLVSPLLDLSDAPDNLIRRQAAESFERVDDVVMGGVSSSKVVPATQ
eukprot:8371707-Pyramimonas_sp.AAC.1